jgi:hypothetical protein
MIRSQIRTASAFLLGTLAALAAIYFALTRTNNETYVGVLILLFIFVGMPCLLFAIRGFFVALRRSPSSSQTSFSILIHVCAAFGALVGVGVYAMIRASDPSHASRAAWLVVIFPAIIYLWVLTVGIVGAVSGNLLRWVLAKLR